MNNAWFQPEEIEELKLDTTTEQVRLTRLIEAIASLLENKDWRTLQELHFSKEKERVERLMLSAAKNSPLEDRELYRLQGEHLWATRYEDLSKYAKLLKNQLENLKHG